MRLTRIFVDQPLSAGSTIELHADATRHLVTVLRAKVGTEVILFNGQGGEYRATLVEPDNKKCVVFLESFNDIERESPLSIHLGIGISRGDRFDHVIQKATELGVSEVTPLYTERTEVKLKGERADKKLRHWRQIAISACEQCQRNRLPLIHQATTLFNWLENTDAEKRLVLHHRGNRALSDYQEKPKNVALLIGPEGGLSAREIEKANNRNFTHLSLGPRILRTETAPVTAIGLLQFLWGDI